MGRYDAHPQPRHRRNLDVEKMVEATPFGRAQRQRGDDRLVRLATSIGAAARDRKLQQIASQLEVMQGRMSRRGT